MQSNNILVTECDTQKTLTEGEIMDKYFLEEVNGEIQVRKVDVDVKGGSVLMGKLYMPMEEAKIITNLETH